MIKLSKKSKAILSKNNWEFTEVREQREHDSTPCYCNELGYVRVMEGSCTVFIIAIPSDSSTKFASKLVNKTIKTYGKFKTTFGEGKIIRAGVDLVIKECNALGMRHSALGL